MSIRLYVSQSEGEFAWDEKTQGIILGAFFLGYVTTNVPGGRMAEKVGGKLIYGLGVFLTSVLTVISPFAAYWGLIPFLFVRVAEGFTEVNFSCTASYDACIFCTIYSLILYVHIAYRV